jgi:hypothetical protein
MTCPRPMPRTHEADTSLRRPISPAVWSQLRGVACNTDATPAPRIRSSRFRTATTVDNPAASAPSRNWRRGARSLHPQDGDSVGSDLWSLSGTVRSLRSDHRRMSGVLGASVLRYTAPLSSWCCPRSKPSASVPTGFTEPSNSNSKHATPAMSAQIRA